MKKTLYFCLIGLAAVGCAGPYRALTPSTLNFQNRNSVPTAQLEISYLYDIQGLTKNKRYSKKERKFGYAAVALRIDNKSSQTVKITKENLKILANGVSKSFVDPNVYALKVKQTSATYLLHGLWGPWRYSYMENLSTGERETEFKYLPVGLAIGIINLIIAESSNKKHRQTLEQNTIFDRSIEPGGTLYGIVIIPSGSYEPLSFEYN